MGFLSHGPAAVVAACLMACSGRSPSPPAPAPPPSPIAATGLDAAPVAPPGWNDVALRIPDAVVDLRYATARNFTGQQLYPRARCLLRAAVADRLAAAADALRPQGHRLLLWDCYRPASIQRELWRLVPDPRFVAEPVFDDAGTPIGGSKHSRGAAVDVSLADAAGTPRPMPTDHDAFGPAASGGRATGAAARNHAALRAAMITAGFEPLPTEWWHYDASNWTSYALSDDPL
jgi:beta-N-acetylhexosaminidase/D-alanyl-D-alanine dipeptidase